jgi:hypothetical protein
MESTFAPRADDQRLTDSKASMRGRSRRYKGFVLTPHSVRVEEKEVRARLWTVGVFLRTDMQTDNQKRYFQLRGVLTSSKSDALKEAISYGKRLIDEELIAYIRRHIEQRRRISTSETYRRARDSLMWHFCERCSFWPKQEYVARRTKPALKLLCNECLALASANRS